MFYFQWSGNTPTSFSNIGKWIHLLINPFRQWDVEIVLVPEQSLQGPVAGERRIGNQA
jgi:hypothetical protein